MSGSDPCALPGRRVLVIGAGPSGLVALKEHLACGNEAIAVERTQRIGGWFASDDDAAYDTLMLTTSNYFMAYSDAPPRKGERMRYWYKKEYAGYLEAYAARFDLERRVEFRTDVVRCAYREGGWVVTTRTGGEDRERRFDAVVACTGSNSDPKWPGELAKGFRGAQLHSSDYKNAARFAGQTVVVVGLGESSADLASEVAAVGERTVVWTRSPPTIAPRFPALLDKYPDEYAIITDEKEANRCEMPDFLEYMTTPRVMQSASVFLVGANKQQYFGMIKDDATASPEARLSAKLIVAATKDAYYQSDQARYITKNGRPLKLLCEKKMELVCAKDLTVGGDAVAKFQNITFADLDACDPPRAALDVPGVDAILWCTGYATKLAWLDEDLPRDPRAWYKHCFVPGYGASLAMVGWARGHQGGIPQMAELLARYHALLVSGARALPPDYAARAKAEGDAETAYYRLSPQLRPLVDYPAFADSVAELIGCAPKAPNPLADPVRFFKYWTYPLWACWYREAGPGAAPDVLDDVLARFPLKTSLAVSRGNSPAPFGVFPMLIIATVSAFLQLAPSLLGLATGKFRLGFTSGWGWAKPKHRVLHRGQPRA